ncbi:MAG: hypothetical protein DLM60_23070 [Pseudonocardiales bacterium]|nr:MAG: hypothetical protein DLM60_23070 [Pseudonocardiales bacterium]
MAVVLNRRRFLTYSGVGAVALAGAGYGIDALISRARTDPLPAGAGVLVMLTLYGGNDGLNTVIPAADPAYQAARPDLAYAESDVLALGDGLGLNPAMLGLKGLWDNQHLAIVRGVSYPQPDHSHFRSMDIWQTASPEHPTATGWLGRWLDANGRDPLHAVSLDPVLPPMLAGATTAGAALPAGGLVLPTGQLGAAFQALGAPLAGETVQQATAARAITDLHRSATTLGAALDQAVARATTAATGSAAPPVKSTKTGQSGGGKKGAGAAGQLAHELDVVATFIEMGAPTRAYSVSIGGFDTHTAERPTQQRLLTEVDAAVTGFVNRMAGSARGRNAVLVAYSEFGRRVAANANQGTDHGTAGSMFVAGAPVRGGFVGDQPSLTDLTDGDLKVTTDFRDVYATLLTDVLGSDPEPVLGPGRAHLPLIAA